MSQQRLKSGKQERHEQAIKKYQEYENSKSNQAKLNDMIKGQRTLPLIPKPGEYMTVATDKPANQQLYMDIPIRDLLDGSKNFSELRMASLERMHIRNRKIPKPPSKFDEAVLKRPQLNQKNDQIDEFGIESIAQAQFTQNLRQIVRRQHKELLSPANEVLQDALEQHLSKSQSQKSLRPISASYLLKNLNVGKEVLENSKGIQNSLMKTQRHLLQSAKPRNMYAPVQEIEVKHLTGFQTISLKAEDFIQVYKEQYKKEKMEKDLEKHFKTSAVDPRLQSPFLREDQLASQKIRQYQEQKGELELTKFREQMFMAEPYRVRQVFLPLDFYYIEEEDGHQLIKKYSKDGICLAQSKWFDTQGNFTWEDCEVLQYLEETDKYEIKFIKANKVKQVTRINLRFSNESEEQYQIQMQIADFYRKQSEVFIKYNYMIDKMDDVTSSLPESQIQRIDLLGMGLYFKLNSLRDPSQFMRLDPSIRYNFKRYLIPKQLNSVNISLKDFCKLKQYKFDTLQSLEQEIKQYYVRANHEITFRRMLPFSEEKQLLFKQFLPAELFEAKIIVKPAYFPSHRGIGPKEYLKLFETMKNSLHQAHARKFQALLDTNITLQRFLDQNLFHHQYSAPITIDELDKAQRWKTQDAIRDFKTRMYDVHYEIMEMVENEVKILKLKEEEKLRLIVLEAERRILQEQGLMSEVLTSLQQFQKLINFKFERAGYELWIRSIESFIGYIEIETSSQLSPLEQIYNHAKEREYTDFKDQLLIQIELNSSTLIIEPNVEDIIKNFHGYVWTAIKELTSVPCMRTREIESARDDQIMHIFESIDDIVITKNKQKVNQLLEKHQKLLFVYVDKLKEFESVMDYNIEKKLKKGSFDEYAKELDKLVTMREEMEKYMFKKQLKLGIFYLNIEHFLQKCLDSIKKASDQIYENLIIRIGKENERLGQEIEKMIELLQREPKNLEQLDQFRTYAKDTLQQDLQVVEKKINKVMEKLTLMEKMNYKISYDNFERTWNIYAMPPKLQEKQQECIRRLQHQEKRFQDDLYNQQGELINQINSMNKDLDKLIMEEDITKIQDIATEFAKLDDQITRAQEQAEIVNIREAILRWKQTDYSEIDKIRKTFTPYYRVWGLGRDYEFKIPNALTGPLINIDRELLTNDVQEAWTELFKLEKTTFKIVQHMYIVTQSIRKMYESFKPYLPLINDLRNPALKKQHWNSIQNILKLDEDPNFSLQSILDKGAMDYRDEIREISETASKQSSFEKNIQKMKYEWKNIKFELVVFRDTDTYILKSVEPILDKLDEDITKIMSIASSPFVQFLLNEVNGWKQQLFKAQEAIELWCKTQKSWQYLQPIFYSEDIIREMPKEGNKYSVVDKMWRSLMQSTFSQPLVMEACFQNRMKENFVFMIDQLDQVIKGLNEFLNKKRTAFPRFFFLSNEELLQILAQAREPRAVQKHLQKCFEGIYELTFTQDLLITHMSSQSQEILELATIVNPIGKEQAVRGVEEWLYEVQQSMKLTIKQNVQNAVSVVASKSLDISIAQIPSQLNVLAHEILFTDMVSKHIPVQTLDKCLQLSTDLLMNTVKLLYQDIQDQNHLLTLGVLIVLQVKQKDIVSELKQKQITKLDDFEWMSQMRYYMEKDVMVRMLHTQRVYGYEYLGNQSRLVITPLTDRCYRTLMASLHMNLGGAPEGPAGTGKTETTKDLAKAVAKHCVVFNCSDQLDYQAMGKFFKGLVSCGSWACFDEFNRIELEVLSVIAQQIQTIQSAIIRDSYSKVPLRSFQFEDATLTLDSTCAIFITMNPGYQGRSELPDNLKALFRSVAMMIPNYAMITEISLYSYGFQNARELSIKITTALKLASEQLSTQSHYDFGMRAVKSIILAAGKLKRETKAEDDIVVLRAIEDCNLPKFTQKDVPLFKAIISDLFPDIVQEDRLYGDLEQHIKTVISNNHLTYSDQLYTKIIQLFETINVRHGLMVVGCALSGKTTIINTLQQSMVAQNQRSLKIHKLNPKSITSRLLYGDVDAATNEWQDGITAVIFRECIDIGGRNWVLFDGPVDALWIENMNTVLDDNKKLCLTNGETIKLTEEMRIVFEVEDLLEASPATVSRCGMVYLESYSGWKSLFSTWYQDLTPNYHQECYFEIFQALYFQLEPIFQEVKKYKPVYQTSQEIQALSCLKLFYAYLLKTKTKQQLLIDLEIENEKEQARIRALQMEGKGDQIVKKQKILQDREKTEIISFFYVSVIWSIGCMLDQDKRPFFSNFLKAEMDKLPDHPELRGATKEVIPPKELSLFEVYFDIEKKNWNLWNSKLDYRIPKGTVFHEIYVPTSESSSIHALSKQILFHNNPLLLYGRTGTGKTMLLKRVLLEDLEQSKFIPTITAFSANTGCMQVLDIIESKLEKQKRRKGIFGPEVGKINIIFIDDLNMPSKEQFGAQPPLELIRQWFIQNGWYDKKTLEFKTIVDIQFCGAMGMGRPNIPQRLSRHFNMIYIPETSHNSLLIILNKIFEYGFDDYIDKVKFIAKQLPLICLKVYKKVSAQFLPLPSKSHYLFNMRDLIKVVQGILQVPSNQYDATGDTKGKILKLWAHENLRVFYDRLINQTDRELFEKVLDKVLDKNQNTTLNTIIGQSNMFGNWIEPHSIQKQYIEFKDYQKILDIINEYIGEFNEKYPKQKLNLVLFEDAVQFMCKINRIISQPYGNAFLIGLGGTGCRTLSRLSAYMQDYNIGELDVDRDFTQQEWYDFWRDLMKSVGLKNEQSIFLFPDAQIINEVFLEDINNILNIGEIINLYPSDDKENICSDFKDVLQKENKEREGGGRVNLTQLQLWEQYVKRCKSNLHIIIYLSPVGDKLKTRLRNFPSLVSCTSTIWVDSWSDEALSQVALHLIPEEEVGRACVGIHQTVYKMTQEYHNKTGYHYYVTPLQYIQLLKNFQQTYDTYTQSILKQKDTYVNGVKMLDECAIIVENMRKELEDLQPVLVQKTLETDQIMRRVEQETAAAEDQKQRVKIDEIETAKKADIAKGISDQCQERLSEAEPQLEEAIKALRTLQVKDFVEIKSFQKPPKLIKLTMDSVCIMNDKKPKKGPDGSEEYWEEAQKMLNNPQNFIKTLENYPRNKIPEKVIQKMTQFLKVNQAQFQPQIIAKANQASEGLCKWVLAIYKYHFVYKEITPLREENEKANQVLAAAQQELQAKQLLLKSVEARCQELREQFENENFQKQKLKAQISDCEIKMKRALDLTGGLSGEKNRWRDEASRLQKNIESLLGDMLLSVGYLSYMGAFTSEFRKVIQDQWQKIIVDCKVPSSKQFQLMETLSNPLEIQDWLLCGLPLDDFSKENAIIMQKSHSYPLIIDPQGQASKFIQRKEKKISEKHFRVTKPDKYLASNLEQCVRDGLVLLLINIGQTLDGVLDPVLNKQYQMINGRPMVTIAGNQVIVNPNFRLYLVTQIPNPHYTPSILTKITLINFTITPDALKDQMTSILVREEEPQLEEEKLRIMNDNNQYKIKMKQIEVLILDLLSKTEGSKMLEDATLITSLQESKITSEEITLRLKEAKLTEDRINQNRLNYDQISLFASNTYFTLNKLNNLDPMYVFSLEFYQRIFKKAIRQAERPQQKNIKQRITFITEQLKRVVFQEVSRSIFVKHKQLFSFMFLLTWYQSLGILNQSEVNYLLNGLPQGDISQLENPDSNLFSENQWSLIKNLSTLENFKGLDDLICQNDSVRQYVANQGEIPEQLQHLSQFQRLLIIRSCREHLFGQYVKELIAEELGTYFTQNIILPIEDSFNDSQITIPLVFILQPGDDPQEDVRKFAQDRAKQLTQVSLGKGQGQNAKNQIIESLSSGQWVILQNCHLAVSWLPELENLLQDINNEQLKRDKDRNMKINSEFRLWMTTMSSNQFPQNLLIDAVKMTKDPPKGIKDNIYQIYFNQNSSKNEKKFYESCGEKTSEFKQFYLSLCYFHAIVRERRRYGPVGWNILYDFNDSDFRISIRQLKQMLQDYNEIPFTALIYLTGECYYGGKVTDDWDRRCLRTLLSTFYRMEIFYDNYKFSKVPEYYIPEAQNLNTIEQVMDFIKQLPDSQPELFGLHPNSEITKQNLETDYFLKCMLDLTSSGVGGLSQDRNKLMQQRAEVLVRQIPKQLDFALVQEKFKIDYYESMNTVLQQEILRYNNLLGHLQSSLNDLILAANGQIVMSQLLERVGDSMLNNVIPESWKKSSYPSLKNLSNYLIDLTKRIQMFQNWIDNGIPKVFWVSGFFFTQSFFTGVLQNHARKFKIPIDQLKFNFEVDPEIEDGQLIEGLFIESAKWNSELKTIDEPNVGQIYFQMPKIKLIPIQNYNPDEIDYICPVYKTSDRKGTLSTTGHSTNYIISIPLKTPIDQQHWVKRGTAMISQLNE